MSSNIFVLKAKGLNTSPNELDREEGSLTEANNIIIRRDGVIEPIRGFKTWGDALSNPDHTIKQIIPYRNRLLRHYSDKIQYDAEGDGCFQDFSGNFTETQDGLRIKSIEANGNLYFTTDEGIKKISAKTSDDFTSNVDYITQAGAIKAVDFEAALVYTQGETSGFLKQDSTVSYRVVWATNDKNDNLVIGSPSQPQIISSSIKSLLASDFNRFLNILDSFSSPTMILDGNYSNTLKLSLSSSAIQIRDSFINLTKKIDNDLYFASTILNNNVLQITSVTIPTYGSTITNAYCEVTFNIDPSPYFKQGQYINISGITSSTANFTNVLTGIRAIKRVDAATKTIQYYIAERYYDVSVPSDLEITSFPKTTDQASVKYASTDKIYLDTKDAKTYTWNNFKYVETTSFATIVLNSYTDMEIYSAEYLGLSKPIEITETSDVYVTNAEWTVLQKYLDSIITKLLSESIDIIKSPDIVRALPTDTTVEYASFTNFPSTGSSTVIYVALDTGKTYKYISSTYYEVTSFNLTNSNNVKLKITIPDGITSDYFYQIYRSNQITAQGVSSIEALTPSDELFLAYEAYPTTTELSSKQIVVVDNTPDDFLGAYLYTNNTQEGILQANDAPPFAKDINRFKETIFYANTRTKHRLVISLLGVAKLITDYKSNKTPTLTIGTKNNSTNIYSFVTGIQHKSYIGITKTGAQLLGKYLFIHSLDNSYYLWFYESTQTDPKVEYAQKSLFPGSGNVNKLYVALDTKTAWKFNSLTNQYEQLLTFTDSLQGIKITVTSADTATTVATKITNILSTYVFDFSKTEILSPSTAVITNLKYGLGTTPSDGNTGIVSTEFASTNGRSEKVTKQTSVVTINNATYYEGLGSTSYLVLNTTNDTKKYCIWLKTPTYQTAPTIAGAIIIPVIASNQNANDMALAIKNVIPNEFNCTILNNVLTIENYSPGKCTATTANNITFSTTVTGALEVLLSINNSAAIAIDETARSLVRVINKNTEEAASAYYLSGVNDVPGEFYLEARTLADIPFYVLANNTNTGTSFNPDISPEKISIPITNGSATIFTVSTGHGLVDNDYIFVTSSTTSPALNGLYPVKYVSNTQFSIAKSIVTTGTASYSTISDLTVSKNEIKPNRIYYSKFQKPEFVPSGDTGNYFDVGAEEKQILRIFPLRDSLFVFKEDGLYRVSGESAPFSKALFDSSVNLLAPDSLCIVDNLIYCWSNQGIQVISESGAQTISRPIDNQILKIASSNYINFPKLTWGIGYGSDSSVTMWTSTQLGSVYADIGFRYNTLTNSWTTISKAPTCGIIFDYDGKMYLGMSDIPYIEQERKTFTRLDYAGREYTYNIAANKYTGNVIKFNEIENIDVGDVIVQEQQLTTYEFNMLLAKLDLDPGIVSTNFYDTLKAGAGDNMRQKIIDLAIKLDNDTGVTLTTYANSIASQSNIAITQVISGKTPIISTAPVTHGLVTGRKITISGSTTTPSIDGTYEVEVLTATTFKITKTVTIGLAGGTLSTVDTDLTDIAVCYNKIISLLNSDSGVSYNTYTPTDSISILEAIVTNINVITKEITINNSLDFVIGDIIVFKALETSYTYSPNTFGDPLNYKHLRQATMMVDSRAITSMVLEFKTDLKPVFVPVEFNLDGNGIFGNTSFGEGFFGGAANVAPIRTLIPRDCQRCRYLVMRFKHSTARESYQINGVSITGNVGLSERAYR